MIENTDSKGVMKRRSPLLETWDNLRRSWGGMIGLALILVRQPDRSKDQ